MKNSILQKELTDFLGERFALFESTRTNYSRGEDIFDPVLSQAVVFPKNNDEISKIVKLCNKFKVPIVPFGTRNIFRRTCFRQ
jgi:FAD/FMN-containing dehydrogenases